MKKLAVAAVILAALAIPFFLGQTGKFIRDDTRAHGGRAPAPADPAAPQAAEPAWIVVDPEELASIEGMPIGGVCFSGRAPRPLQRADLEIPKAHPLHRIGAVLVVHTLINTRGRVVKAQILKGPDTATIRAAVAQCLKAWRFEPAIDDQGKPAAVHFILTLPVTPQVPASRNRPPVK